MRRTHGGPATGHKIKAGSDPARVEEARLGAAAQAAEDATSQIFTKALGMLPRFRPDGGSFRSWLFVIAHHRDDRILPDGRIAALVTIGMQPAGVTGVPTGIPVMHVLVPGDCYLIDEVYVPMLME